MLLRPSSVFLVFAGLALLVFTGLLLLTPMLHATRYARVVEKQGTIVGELGLTDLCLFTEARYTRHPSQADLHSAFQDHPMAFEHFPSGSLVHPPVRIWGSMYP